MDPFTYLESVTANWRLIIAAVASVFVIYWLVVLVSKFINYRHLKQREMVWLEITPPSSVEKTPEATEQLFSVIHGTRAARPLKDKVLNRAPVMSFEIVSTRKGGIRYLIQVEKAQSKNIQKVITSYVSDSKVKEIPHEFTSSNSVIEFKESGHYVLPLTLTSIFEQHDPLSYITGAMTNLSDDEQVVLQLVVKPVKLREASILSHKILGNENILEQVQGKQLSLFGRFSRIFSNTAFGITGLTNEVYMGTTYGHKNYYESKTKQRQSQAPDSKRDRPSRTLSAFELELMETMHKKVTQPLFQVNLRILVKSHAAKEHIAALRSVLDGFSVPPYQSLKAKSRFPVLNEVRHKLANDRLPSLARRNSMILAASELASLYHFPSRRISKTDNMITSLSRTLPAPVSLKSGRKLDVIIGNNHHSGAVTAIGLTEAERERHLYIIGGTGNGKTTMLLYAIKQDIENGKGIAVVDPHGDLAETILRHVPEDRIKDVVYFNPDDLARPIGLNLLELTEGVAGDELLREKDLVTESVISIFRKIFSDEDTGGHRIEYVLRNAVQTALTVKAATLFTVYELLNNPKYRTNIVATLEDENLKNFWRNEFGKAGGFQKVKMAAGITAKIGRFLFSASAKRILEQPKSTIDFDNIINEGKILICNFSKGLLGEDTSELFGIAVLAKLQLASLRRARIKQSERRPFYLYVDEFQNFATMSFVQMLSESRKYKLFLLMAEQSTSQQDDHRMVNIILANVGTIVCFRTGNPADERAVLQMFTPYIEAGEIANLAAFNYFVRIAAIRSQEPLSGETILLDNDGSEEITQKIIKHSRTMFAIEYKQAKKKETVQSTHKIKKPDAKRALPNAKSRIAS